MNMEKRYGSLLDLYLTLFEENFLFVRMLCCYLCIYI